MGPIVLLKPAADSFEWAQHILGVCCQRLRMGPGDILPIVLHGPN